MYKTFRGAYFFFNNVARAMTALVFFCFFLNNTNALGQSCTIAGSPNVCAGSNITLTHGTCGSGGSWAWGSLNPAIATVSSTGVVHGLATGTAIIDYTDGTSFDTMLVTVDTPAYLIGGGGTFYHCGVTGILTSIAGAPTGGSWGTTNPLIAVYGGGNINAGGVAGAATVSYTKTNACGTTTASQSLVTLALARPISGVPRICVGSSFTFTDPVTGGVWSNYNTSVASVDASGIVTGVGAGVDTIYYTVDNSAIISWCVSVAKYVVTVVNPSIDSFTGPSAVCASSAATFVGYPSGGTWSVSSAYASISSGGVLSVAAMPVTAGGTVAVHYTCGSVSAVRYISLHPLPYVAPLAGASYVCEGDTVMFSDSVAGGYWVSSVPSRATVDSFTGVVTGVPGTAGGTTYISYIVPAVHGSLTCYGSDAYNLSVVPLVHARPVIGPSYVCLGSSMVLTDSAGTYGATWASSDTSVARVGLYSGSVTGLSAGTVVITYTISSLCNSSSAYVAITVLGAPSAGTISVPSPLCVGVPAAIIATGPTTYGIWGSSSPAIAAATLTGPLACSVTGLSAGTATLTYIAVNACGSDTATQSITISPTPDPISGSASVCEGASTTLTDAIAGGTWLSSDASIASVDPFTGVATGVAAGTVIITYMLPAGCFVTMPFTVNPLPIITISAGTAAATSLPLVNCDHAYTLTGHGALSYTWSGTYGLYDPATGLGILPAVSYTTVDFHGPTTSITYTVVGTTALGCTDTGYITILAPTCNSSFCQAFAGAPIYGLSGNVGSPGVTTIMPAGNYNVYGNVTFFGSVYFTGNVLAIGPGFSLKVDAQGDAHFDSCHLYCCDTTQLWQGIVLNTNSAGSGRVALGHNTLLEDAATGIKLANGILPAASGLNIIACDGAVFNKCKTGIEINQFPALGSYAPPPPFTYPFLVRNSVFTSRKLSNIYSAIGTPTTSYPMIWPAAQGTPSSLKEPYGTPFTFTPPFNVVNPNGGGHAGYNYPYQACNGGALANIGISLLNVGAYYASGSNSPAAFSEIVIGDNSYVLQNKNCNLFDTLLEGIYAKNTNFVSFNNAFIYMHKPPLATASSYTNLTGDGIGAQNTAGGSASAAYPKFSMSVTGSNITGANTNNLFFDCIRGITCYDYYYIRADNSFLIGHPSTLNTFATGYYVKSSRYYNVSMSGNTITNVATGISMNTSVLGSAASTAINQLSGNLSIRANTIQANLAGLAPATGMAVVTGIVVNSVLLSTTYSGMYVIGMAHADANRLNYIDNGIAITGYKAQTITSDSNQLSVYNRAGSWQFGIKHTACIGSNIGNNRVTGPGWATPVPTPFPVYMTGTPMKIGIGVYNSFNTNVSCNLTEHINTGYQYVGAGNTSQWHNNEMRDNAYGMVLQGHIGNQGSHTIVSNNVWDNTFSNWVGSHYNIFTLNGATPTDTIFVNANLSISPPFYSDPLNNNGNPFLSFPFYYGFGTTGFNFGLFINSGNAEVPDCISAYSPVPKPLVAVKGPFYTGEAAPALNWIAQFSLWQALQRDASYGAGVPELQQFAAMAQNSRYAWLTRIEAALAAGDDAAAEAMLAEGLHDYINTGVDAATGIAMQDGEGADAVVSTYIAFYRLYLAYKNGVLSGNDSALLLAIGNLCPYTFGGVVHDAQALYRQANEDDSYIFSNDCEPGIGGKGTPPPLQAQAVENTYSIYPNPNKGAFTIIQSIADAAPVAIEVQDALGRRIYTALQCFTNGRLQLDLGYLPSGVYMLRLMEGSAGNITHNFKFTAQ